MYVPPLRVGAGAPDASLKQPMPSKKNVLIILTPDFFKPKKEGMQRPLARHTRHQNSHRSILAGHPSSPRKYQDSLVLGLGAFRAGTGAEFCALKRESCGSGSCDRKVVIPHDGPCMLIHMDFLQLGVLTWEDPWRSSGQDPSQF